MAPVRERMDPNETLRLIRLTAKQYRVDRNGPLAAAHADQLVEFIEALDEWLTGGGFPPGDWKAGE